MTTVATPDPGRRLVDHMRDAALLYASRGWYVFPLIPSTKRPACPGHPAARCDRSDPWCRHGHTGWEQRATTNDARIQRAWSSTPYGIGIACGPSRLLVIDTDQPKTADHADGVGDERGGDKTLAQLEAAQRRLPPTYTVQTPSGGTHRYFAVPDGLQLGNTAGQLGQLIDTRGTGGYVVAAPTVIGRAYTVIANRRPAPLPDWLIQLLTPPAHGPATALSGFQTTGRHAAPAGPLSRYVIAALANEAARVRGALPGQRNDFLFRAAVALGQLVGSGQLDEHTARNRLREACTGHIIDQAFTAVQADATITSGLTRGAAEPRTGRTTA
jgi:hypothetical protein